MKLINIIGVHSLKKPLIKLGDLHFFWGYRPLDYSMYFSKKVLVRNTLLIPKPDVR